MKENEHDESTREDEKGNPPSSRTASEDAGHEKAGQCANGHTWTHQWGDDWTPDRGTPCDCGGKQWGVPLTQAREHEWQFYANGSFCKRCGASIGSGQVCR